MISVHITSGRPAVCLYARAVIAYPAKTPVPKDYPGDRLPASSSTAATGGELPLRPGSGAKSGRNVSRRGGAVNGPPSLGGSGGDQKDRHANHHADHHEPDIGHGKILIWATVTGSYRQTRSVLRWDRTSQAPSVTRQVWPLVMARPFSLSKIIR